MTTKANTAKGLTLHEMDLLRDFSNQVRARQHSAGVTVSKLELSYTVKEGFTIILEEESNVTEVIEGTAGDAPQ